MQHLRLDHDANSHTTRQKSVVLKILLATVLAISSSLAGFAYADTAELYQHTCATCHGPGVLGAPKSGDKAAWAARIKSEGMPTLLKHAKEGYKNMPAHGLCNTCSDADYQSLIEYMAK